MYTSISAENATYFKCWKQLQMMDLVIKINVKKVQAAATLVVYKTTLLVDWICGVNQGHQAIKFFYVLH